MFIFSKMKIQIMVFIYGFFQDMLGWKNLEEKFKADIAASFEHTISTTLTKKVLRALEKYPHVKEVHLAGGVSANSYLRTSIQNALNSKYTFRYPQNRTFCTDNAAMIGCAGYYQYLAGKRDELDLNAIPSLKLATQA